MTAAATPIAPAGERPAALLDEPRPIFIIGAPRSGTSVLTWCIGQHSNIIVLPETNWLAAFASQIGSFWQLGSLSGFTTQLSSFRVSRQAFAAEFGRSIDRIMRDSFETRHGYRRQRLRGGARPARNLAWLRHADDPKQRWVDGTPANTPYTLPLAELFPAARFIHLVRNPRDTLLSQFAAVQRQKHHPGQLEAVHYVYNCARAGYLTELVLGPQRVARLRFADLVGKAEAALTGIFAFLGEQFEPDCVNPLQQKINSSDPAAKARAERELDATVSSYFDELEAWYRASADPAWRIPVAPDAARTALEAYAVPIQPA